MRVPRTRVPGLLAAAAVLAATGCRYQPVVVEVDADEPAPDAPRPASDAPRSAPDAAGGVSGKDAAAPDTGASERPPACIPAVEICNGADDDCDGATDEGCPMADAVLLTQGPRAASPVFGSLGLDGGKPIDHRCPPGQVVVAFTGNSGYAIDSLGVVCSSLRVREDRGATPFRYSLGLEPGASFDPVGGISGGVNNATRCPPGFLASGISAWPTHPTAACPAGYCAAGGSAPACATNFGLEVLCSRYQIDGSPGSFRLTRIDELPFRTAARVEVDLTSFGFPNAKSEYPCPDGQLVVEAVGNVGPWPYDCSKTTVNGLRVACTQPTVPMR